MRSVVVFVSCLLYLVLYLVPLTGYLDAQTEELTVGNHAGAGARAVGMGGAFTGVADDVSALFWNPAGLILMDRIHFLLEASHGDRQTGAILLSSGDTMEAQLNRLRFTMLGGVFPLLSTSSHVTFGIGVHRVQDLDAETRVRGRLTLDAPVLAGMAIDERDRNRGGIYRWHAGVAGYVSRRIAIGGMLDIWTGDHEEELISDITDPADVSEIERQRLEDTIDRSYLSFGLRAGALMQVNRTLRVGTQIQMPMSLEVDEFWTQRTYQRADDGSEIDQRDEGTLLYDLRLPWSVSLGVSLGDARARIASDIQYTNWTSTRYSIPPEASIQNSDFEDYYRDVVQWRFGGEYLLEALRTKVRAGFWNHPLAFTGKEIVRDRRFLTLGVGIFLDEDVELNVTYVRGRWRQDSDVLAEDVRTHQVFVAAIYRLHRPPHLY